MRIRDAAADDVPAITAIYNDAIEHTVATFDTQPKSVEEQQRWFEDHAGGGKYPVLIAELDGETVGWSSLSAWSSRRAYAETAEISVYVKAGFRGRGFGRRLAESVLRAGRGAGFHSVIALIESGNEASMHILETLGFDHVGVMHEVGRKFERLLDVTIMQLIFKDS
jgi:phosphinothricin acetyltransferase